MVLQSLKSWWVFHVLICFAVPKLMVDDPSAATSVWLVVNLSVNAPGHVIMNPQNESLPQTTQRGDCRQTKCARLFMFTMSARNSACCASSLRDYRVYLVGIIAAKCRSMIGPEWPRTEWYYQDHCRCISELYLICFCCFLFMMTQPKLSHYILVVQVLTVDTVDTTWISVYVGWWWHSQNFPTACWWYMFSH